MIINREVIPKDISLNSNYKGTGKWTSSPVVIKLETKNGGKSTIDELPANGGVMRMAQDLEKKTQNGTYKASNSVNSAERVHTTSQVEPNKSQSQIQIPILNQNNLSAFSSNNSKSKIPKPISRSNTRTSFFYTDSIDQSLQIFKFNKEGRLIILNNNHPFLEKIEEERKKNAQSYRNATRIDNLTDNEMKDLISSYIDKAIAVGKPSFKA